VWLGCDRDQRPEATNGIFHVSKAPFADVLAHGRHPGLRAKTL